MEENLILPENQHISAKILHFILFLVKETSEPMEILPTCPDVVPYVTGK